MVQQISVVLKTAGALAINNGIVADPAGNLWDLPAAVNVPSGGQVTVIATADVQNPNAVYPGSNITLSIETPVVNWTSAATPVLITPVIFMTNFSEFNNSTLFPVANIQFWLDVAYKQVRSSIWQNQLDLGAQLYAAHNLVLEAQALKATKTGGIPGASTGPANNKSVDKVSVGYDTTVAAEEGAGNWNLTTYGARYIHMVRLFGAGGIQVGVNDFCGNPFFGW